MAQTREQIENRMRDITAFIEQSAETVRAGHMVTLHHLDDEVAALCDAAITLPPAEAKEIQPMMANMINRLEDLSTALQNFQRKGSR